MKSPEGIPSGTTTDSERGERERAALALEVDPLAEATMQDWKISFERDVRAPSWVRRFVLTVPDSVSMGAGDHSSNQMFEEEWGTTIDYVGGHATRLVSIQREVNASGVCVVLRQLDEYGEVRILRLSRASNQSPPTVIEELSCDT